MEDVDLMRQLASEDSWALSSVFDTCHPCRAAGVLGTGLDVTVKGMCVMGSGLDVTLKGTYILRGKCRF